MRRYPDGRTVPIDSVTVTSSVDTAATVRADLLENGQPLESYPWSSYGEYLKAAGQRYDWLRVDRLLGEWGIPRDSSAGRRQFARCLEERQIPWEERYARLALIPEGAQVLDPGGMACACGADACRGRI